MKLLTKRAQLGTLAVLSLGCLLCSITPSKAETFAQRHPRRAEVLRRDARLNNTINRDFGHLNGHYGQLKREDSAIRQQEQAEARFNGGHITKPEQRQLNQEENGVRNQINADLGR
jgi:hypothetical protein